MAASCQHLLSAKETDLETKYHHSVYMGHTKMRPEPWAVRGERFFFFFFFKFLLPLNMAMCKDWNATRCLIITVRKAQS